PATAPRSAAPTRPRRRDHDRGLGAGGGGRVRRGGRRGPRRPPLLRLRHPHLRPTGLRASRRLRPGRTARRSGAVKPLACACAGLAIIVGSNGGAWAQPAAPAGEPSPEVPAEPPPPAPDDAAAQPTEPPAQPPPAQPPSA